MDVHQRSKMKRSVALAIAVGVAAVSAVAGVDVAPFGVNADLQFRSAYHSRMRVAEDRPVAVVDVRMHADVGPFGRVGVMHWNYSSLCNRRSTSIAGRSTRWISLRFGIMIWNCPRTSRCRPNS